MTFIIWSVMLCIYSGYATSTTINLATSGQKITWYLPSVCRALRTLHNEKTDSFDVGGTLCSYMRNNGLGHDAPYQQDIPFEDLTPIQLYALYLDSVSFYQTANIMTRDITAVEPQDFIKTVINANNSLYNEVNNFLNKYAKADMHKRTTPMYWFKDAIEAACSSNFSGGYDAPLKCVNGLSNQKLSITQIYNKCTKGQLTAFEKESTTLDDYKRMCDEFIYKLIDSNNYTHEQETRVLTRTLNMGDSLQ